MILRSLTGMVIAVALIRALEIFDLVTEHRIEEPEQSQIITAERERLARELDLHLLNHRRRLALHAIHIFAIVNEAN